MAFSDPKSILRSIQEEYFSILEETPIIQDSVQIDNNCFKLAPNLMSSKMLVPTKYGLKPSILSHIELLFSSIRNFWLSRQADQFNAIHKLTGKLIHVDARPASYSLRQYGPFFNAVLISDQLLISGSDYWLSETLDDPIQLIKIVVQSAFKYISEKEIYLPQGRDPLAYVVPATHPLDKASQKRVIEATRNMSAVFFSEAFNKEFKDAEQFVDFAVSTKMDLNEEKNDILQNIYAPYNATNFSDYLERRAKVVHRDLGQNWGFYDNPVAFFANDVFGRFHEFERFSADAYLLAQDVEIPQHELQLYEWWLNASAKKAGASLGAFYSEDFLCKVVPHAHNFAFLAEIPQIELLRFLWSDPVEKLREDLSLSRCKIRRGKLSLSATINEAGEYVSSRLSAFRDDFKSSKASGMRKLFETVGGFIGSIAITVASVPFPPLSILTLIWSRSATDIVHDVSVRRKTIKESLDRPIATLALWHVQKKQEKNTI
jgi:hypothetical protein